MISQSWVTVGNAAIWIVFGFYLGYSFKNFKEAIKSLRDQLASLSKPKEEPKPSGPQSSFIDPTNIVQVAQFEQDQLQKRLNG